jgi:hypothetical protein
LQRARGGFDIVWLRRRWEGNDVSPVRRAILLLLATVMVVSGIWLLYEQFTASTIIYGKFLLGGAALVLIGLVLLWEDLIAPMIGRKT